MFILGWDPGGTISLGHSSYLVVKAVDSIRRVMQSRDDTEESGSDWHMSTLIHGVDMNTHMFVYNSCTKRSAKQTSGV